MNIARGLLHWGILLTGAFVALEAVGYDPGPLLVTGGLVSVAVGFASQTSLSNLIGGLFLAADEPFKVGDYVKVGEHEGMVLSVDPLSTKLRTVQNVFVRIPNETLLKAVIHNFSRYTVRRLDVAVHVPLETPIDALQAALLDAARKCEVVLVEPAPFVQIEALGEVTMRAQLRVWIGEADVLGARSALSRGVNDALRGAGIGLGAPPGTMTSAPPSAGRG
jgi:small-conductance mechanosensitive channel